MNMSSIIEKPRSDRKVMELFRIDLLKGKVRAEWLCGRKPLG
jgi:hypothetical protein